MRVLVTGGSGFIGRWVVKALEARGDIPVAYDRLRFRADGGLPLAERVLGDVRDPVFVSESVALCDGVIHLAGVLGTQETIQYPTPAVETNITGSLNVFEACTRYRTPCVYITVGNHWMQNPYSITKTTAERFAHMYNQERGAQISIVRALNAYGPGQKTAPVRKIIPTFIQQALKGGPIEIYGDGTQVMDLIYVEDLADILVRALGKPAAWGEVYSAGTGRPTTVNEIAEAVWGACGQPLPLGGVLRHLPMRPGEPPQSVVVGDPQTLSPLFLKGPQRLTSLTPLDFLPLAEGLQRTVAYYRERPGA